MVNSKSNKTRLSIVAIALLLFFQQFASKVGHVIANCFNYKLNFPTTIVAVSYTHLDVYKRQDAGLFKIDFTTNNYLLFPSKLTTAQGCTIYVIIKVRVVIIGLKSCVKRM